MELDYSGDIMERGGGGGALMGLLAGSALNRDRDDGKTSTMMIVLAVIFFVIIFIIAIIALAMFNKDRGYDKVHSGGNYGEMIAAMIAAKGMDNGCKNGEIDKFEIMQKLEHNEDRARETQTQQEIGSVKSELGALGLMMQKTASDNEKDNLKEFGEIKGQLGMLSQGVNTLLIERNNAAIIQGVVNQLMCGKPCFA